MDNICFPFSTKGNRVRPCTHFKNSRFKKEKLLPQNIADGLSTSNPRTPKFYLSPKIHKPNNPGCLDISSVDCHTSNISRYVEYHL